MSEEKILQAVERIEGRIDELSKNLNDKIDTVSKDLKDFKEETRENFRLINDRVDKFEEETRINFVSMSQMLGHTNERITAVDKKVTELDKKMEKRFEDNNRELGNLLNSAFKSIDKTYVKKEKVV